MAYRVKGHHLGAVNPSQVASAIIRQKKKQANMGNLGDRLITSRLSRGNLNGLRSIKSGSR